MAKTVHDTRRRMNEEEPMRLDGEQQGILSRPGSRGRAAGHAVLCVLLGWTAVNAQTVSFAGRRDYPFANGPAAVAVGDFNHDGVPDMAVVNSKSSNVSILLGNGDGTFRQTGNIPVGFGPVAALSADFNGDGLMDVAVLASGPGAGTISILLSKGDGTFRPPFTASVGSQPVAIATADFNNDGIADLAAVNSDSNTASVLLGKGDGTFATAVSVQVPSHPTSVAVGEFNGDGYLDLVVTSRDNNSVAVLAGKGDGTFQAYTSFAVGPAPQSVVVADFNHDGVADLAISNAGSYGTANANTVSVMLGRGDGTFGTVAYFGAGLSPGVVVAGDFNGDGKLDVAVTVTDTGGASPVDTAGINAISSAGGERDAGIGGPGGAGLLVFLGKGEGTLQTPAAVGAGASPTVLTAADLNGDGRVDLVVVNQDSVSILLGKAGGFFQTGVTTATQLQTPTVVAVADLNGDGKPDLAITHTRGNPPSPNTIGVLLGIGDGTFRSTQLTLPNMGADVAAFGDFNGDGKQDLVVIDKLQSQVWVFLGNGAGGFSAQAAFIAQVQATPVAVAIGDFDGNHKLDMAIVTTSQAGTQIFLGNGDGTFQRGGSFPTADLPAAVVVGDFNGDGKLDLAVACNTLILGIATPNVSILLGNGDGSFQTAQTFRANVTPGSLAAGDFNGDGKLDLAVANGASNDVSILMGKGDGTFQAPVNIPVGLNPGTIVAADFNGDAKIDLAVLDTASNNVAVLLGNGNGTFQSQALFGGGVSALSLVTADFNGDGKLDLAVVNNGSNDVTVLLNTTVPASGLPSLLVPNTDVTFAYPLGSSAPAAQGVTVSSSGAAVTFNVSVLSSGGWLAVNAQNGTTPQTLQITVNPAGLAVGNYTGTVLISSTGALNSPRSIMVHLLVVAAGTPVITRLENAAGFAPEVAQNTYIEIDGINLAQTSRQWQTADFVNNQLPTQLDGVSVTINSKPAYVYYISSKQLNVLSPLDTTEGPVSVQVTNNSANSAPVTTTMKRFSPGFFAFFSDKYVAGTHLDGSYLGPTSLIPGVTTPAKPGELVVLYGSGFGQTNPPVVDRALTQTGTLSPFPVVKIGGVQAVVQFAGVSAVGEYQFNVYVPASALDGDNTLTAEYNGFVTPPGVFIFVQH